MINYSLDDSGIFNVTFSCSVTADEIINYLLEFELLNNLPDDFLSLYDLTDADIKLKQKDILFISELTLKVTSFYRSVRTAFLVNNPVLTAYSYLFINNSIPKKTTRKIFSTKVAAINWLKEK